MRRRLVIVWTGASNPAYQGYFKSLAHFVEVHVICPPSSKHGSVQFTFPSGDPLEGQHPSRSTEKPILNGVVLHLCRFIHLRNAFYLIPALPILLLKIRPDVIYWMDEADRISTALHLGFAKWFCPRSKKAVFGLQNIRKPGYYQFHHSLAWHLNRYFIDAFIAATEEAQIVAQSHGLNCPSAVIPLFADEELFRPPTIQEKELARSRIGIQKNHRVLAYAGTLHQAKGVFHVMRVASAFKNVRIIVATGQEWPDAEWPKPYHLFKNLRGDELLSLYHAADAVILASEPTRDWKEQIGRILIEGCLSGCLALGSDSGAIPFVLGNPELTFRSGSDESLRQLLDRWQSGILESHREVQRQWITSRFSVGAVTRQTIQFLFPDNRT